MSKKPNLRQGVGGDIEKCCPICGEWKILNLDNFYKNNTKHGYFTYCIPCTRTKSLKRRNIHRQEHDLSNKKLRQNPDYNAREATRLKMRREQGLEAIWRKENKDKIKRYNQNYSLHKKHEVTKNEWLLCKEYFNNSCAYCGINEKLAIEEQKQHLHKDHAINMGANDLSNCVPSCKKCNCEKHKDDWDQWFVTDNPRYNPIRHNRIIKWLSEDYKNTNE